MDYRPHVSRSITSKDFRVDAYDVVTLSTVRSQTACLQPYSNQLPFTPPLRAIGKQSRSTSLPSSTPHPLLSVSSAVSASTTSRTTILAPSVFSDPWANLSTPRHGTGTTTTSEGDSALLSIRSVRLRPAPSSLLRSLGPLKPSLAQQPFRSSELSLSFWTPRVAR